jgi:hypothetical protein
MDESTLMWILCIAIWLAFIAFWLWLQPWKKGNRNDDK